MDWLLHSIRLMNEEADSRSLWGGIYHSLDVRETAITPFFQRGTDWNANSRFEINNYLTYNPMRILYADDDSDDRELFAQIIAEIDPEINVVQAVDGIETLSLLWYGVLPDLIFLDINMPKLNGNDTLRQIRKDPRLKDTKIVMYSTSIDENTIQTYRSLMQIFSISLILSRMECMR